MIRPIINGSLISGAGFNNYIKPQITEKSPNFGQGFGFEHIAFADYDYTFENAERAMGNIVGEFGIKKEEIKSVCDFGCGSGGPTMVLKEIFNPDCLVAVDDTDYYKGPDRSVFKCCDGIKYLKSGEDKFDLIAAQNLGPLVDVEDLLKAAPKSLNENGKFLAYSDSMTMGDLTSYIERKGITDFKLHKGDGLGMSAVLIDKKRLN